MPRQKKDDHPRKWQAWDCPGGELAGSTAGKRSAARQGISRASATASIAFRRSSSRMLIVIIPVQAIGGSTHR
ncbi:hypothetical protein LMG27952_06931 [Paraburkholderia hiiakae]|uniref:Uncharacterized protein n=1 Tax=Paraburkholderia hiiakae TaxID=1081782 RepID=A0ABN7IDG0_9BURK|nr:hypothetical protein LMG27952_06931 [Paraburkholderia hiiakae]